MMIIDSTIPRHFGDFAVAEQCGGRMDVMWADVTSRPIAMDTAIRHYRVLYKPSSGHRTQLVSDVTGTILSRVWFVR